MHENIPIIQDEAQRLIEKLSHLRDRYSELGSSSSGGIFGMNLQFVKDLSQEFQSYGSYVEALDDRRQMLSCGNIRIALLSVTDSMDLDLRLKKLWTELKQLVRLFKCCICISIHVIFLIV